MSEEKIEIGDTVCVSVDAEANIEYNGVVEHIPSATGDCWHIRDSYNHLYYVQQFYIMTRTHCA